MPNLETDLLHTKPGFRTQPTLPSLSEVHRSLVVPPSASFFRKLFAFAGPGFLVAVGYMDPGNWATDLAGGSKYNFTLLSVIMLSNFMAILLQALSLKLGIVTGRDLAQACRDHYSRPVSFLLWVICELAIAACDLAEIIGSAIPLNLLFRLALMFALFINAAILIVSAATFYTRGRNDIAEIQDAYKLLSPLLGVTGASTLFALALLASGQNSTLTGTLAGQIVMEGFLEIRIRPWLRRLITRAIAIIPAVIVTVISGEKGTTNLLVLSQVILSLQLSFAVFPLVIFTSDKLKMGEFVNGLTLKCLAWFIAVVIASLNAWLLVQMFQGWFA